MIKDIANLTVIQTGPGTKIRDLGRGGFTQFGVPLSGPGDLEAFLWNNHLLKNSPGDAQLEIQQPGLKLQFEQACQICISGASSTIKLNGKNIACTGVIEIQEGDLLEIGKFLRGSLIYLGIRGGFQTQEILGSRSQLNGITDAASITKGAKIPFFTNLSNPVKTTFSHPKWDNSYLEKEEIRVYSGPEWYLLDPNAQKMLLSRVFHISSMKNTMAIQLEELIPNQISDILTAPVFPGTIQLTSGGKLLVLQQDAQVTGGYPRVLQIDEKDLRVIAQKAPGQKICFQLVSEV
ncbi:5-oxoprolinase subunit C family protein [Algoriphagus algorifonticola]|uniref:5-oxoprolinase subunit C family protein n=1 Tax=Algoriphagus algorifonticola TaxID=2593007 RepID=UPI0011AA5EF4|nr:biotin-dependent carboxyltransferase family protein [Algoriphagus algorifonticola]